MKLLGSLIYTYGIFWLVWFLRNAFRREVYQALFYSRFKPEVHIFWSIFWILLGAFINPSESLIVLTIIGVVLGYSVSRTKHRDSLEKAIDKSRELIYKHSNENLSKIINISVEPLTEYIIKDYKIFKKGFPEYSHKDILMLILESMRDYIHEDSHKEIAKSVLRNAKKARKGRSIETETLIELIYNIWQKEIFKSFYFIVAFRGEENKLRSRGIENIRNIVEKYSLKEKLIFH